MREKKSFKDRNIVIVCEGSTTEYNYISEVCEYARTTGKLQFTNYTILPIIETPISSNPNRRKYKRHLMGNKEENRYYAKSDSIDNYRKFKGQPTRYLREAQLFIEEDGYVEGWAVYDKDKHTDHAGATNLLDSDSRLKVAFSSYSFEEWLLCHFERNFTSFNQSDCCDHEGHSYKCGENRNTDNNCKGTICIAGRLRQLRYIPGYSKTQTKIFQDYTLTSDGSISEVPLINSAWLRYKQNENDRFNANPYTDVDKLLLYLMNDPRRFFWYGIGTPIPFPHGDIMFNRHANYIKITNISHSNILLPKNCIISTDSFGNAHSYPDKSQLLSPNGEFALEISDICGIRLNIDNISIFIEI